MAALPGKRIVRVSRMVDRQRTATASAGQGRCRVSALTGKALIRVTIAWEVPARRLLPRKTLIGMSTPRTRRAIARVAIAGKTLIGASAP